MRGPTKFRGPSHPTSLAPGPERFRNRAAPLLAGNRPWRLWHFAIAFLVAAHLVNTWFSEELPPLHLDDHDELSVFQTQYKLLDISSAANSSKAQLLYVSSAAYVQNIQRLPNCSLWSIPLACLCADLCTVEQKNFIDEMAFAEKQKYIKMRAYVINISYNRSFVLT